MRMLVAAIGAIALVFTAAQAQTPAVPQPAQGDAILKDFRFRSGETLPGKVTAAALERVIRGEVAYGYEEPDQS